MLRFLPNGLSLLRLLLTPLIYWTIVQGKTSLSFVVLAVALATDVLDGWLARRFHWSTPQGQILDPLADKIFVIGLFAALAVKGLVPLWLTVIVVARDLVLLGGGLLLWMRRKQVLPARDVGKLNTLFQMVMGAMALAGLPLFWIVGLMFITLILSSWLYGRQAFKLASSS